LVHSKLGYHHRDHPFAHLEGQRVDSLDLPGPQHGERQARGVDAHRQHLPVVEELRVGDGQGGWVWHHFARGVRQVVLAAQHAGQVRLLHEAQLNQVGSHPPAVNDLRLQRLLKLRGGHQLLFDEQISDASHGRLITSVQRGGGSG
jgi:hypothetical protein